MPKHRRPGVHIHRWGVTFGECGSSWLGFRWRGTWIDGNRTTFSRKNIAFPRGIYLDLLEERYPGYKLYLGPKKGWKQPLMDHLLRKP